MVARLGRSRRLGLRARLTTAFAVGAATLSVMLSLLTYGFERNYLLRQRQNASIRQTFVDARLFRVGLQSGRSDIGQLLSSLATGGGSKSVARRGGQWFSTSLAVGSNALPSGLRQKTGLGQPAMQSFRLAGIPQLAIGVPLPSVDATYFEVFSLADIDRTLGYLATTLTLVAAVTTVAGAAVGRWASRRVLMPLREVASAAAEIAGGRMDTRLDVGGDRDLNDLVLSFNSMVGSLAERIERDARFASDVSHELRSPLTTLVAAVDVLESRRDELSQPGRRALELLAADTRRFEQLVQDLLEISRFDAGVIELTLEDIAIVDLVRHTLTRMGAAAVPVRVEAGAADAVVRADKRRLDRVIVNLINNANIHGRGVTGVTISLTEALVRISVEDSGPGVGVQERAQIFERFARGGAAGRRSSGEGVGLGLSLVAEQVRVHGGRVWVEDRPSGGARFVVELPTVST